MTWGLHLYCPAGTGVPQSCRDDISECENLVCQAGYLCPTADTRIECPAGYYCKNGINSTTRCEPGWTQTREQRCPQGMAYEPARPENFVILLLCALPLYLILECASSVEKRRRISRTKERTGRDNEESEFFNNLPVSQRNKVPIDERTNALRFIQICKGFGSDDKELDGRSDSASKLKRAFSNEYTRIRLQPTQVAFTDADREPSAGSDPPSRRSLKHQNTFDLAKGGGAQGMRLMGRVLLKISLHDLTFKIGGVSVLRDICTIMQQGELVALMGESGSGKTTLLNVLGGRASYGTTSGRISLNNQPYSNRQSNLIGYVPQAHLVFKELTVYENLVYSAVLRLRKSDNTTKYRHELVESALDLLGLQPCRHFVCDPAIGERLSGGQMRRVGIGVELVCDPPIMLLDEPTSALDAVNTRLVVAALKDLARRGVLVLASLHQPRQTAYEMIDRLILLRKGELIYGGMVTNAPQYFLWLGYTVPEHSNPADFFIEVAFGFETSNKKAFELPACFGLRYNKTDDELSALPDLHAKRDIRADNLGMLWRQWHLTSMRTAELVMGFFDGRSIGYRKFFIRLLKRKSSKNKQTRNRGSVATTRRGVDESASPRKQTGARRGSLVADSVDPRLLGVSMTEFNLWFMSHDGFKGSIRPEVADSVWHAAKRLAEAEIRANPSSRFASFFTSSGDVNFVGLQPSVRLSLAAAHHTQIRGPRSHVRRDRIPSRPVATIAGCHGHRAHADG